MKPELRERRGRCYQGKCGLLERLRQRRAPSPYADIGIVGKVLPIRVGPRFASVGCLASVRHETADWGTCEQIARHAAENPFAQTAVSIRAGDEQVGAFLLSEFDQLSRAGSFSMKDDPGTTLDAMPCQIAGDVTEPFKRSFLVAGPANFGNRNARRLVQQRKRILDGAPRFAHILPCNYHVFGLQRSDIPRNEERRTAKPQNGLRLDRANRRRPQTPTSVRSPPDRRCALPGRARPPGSRRPAATTASADQRPQRVEAIWPCPPASPRCPEYRPAVPQPLSHRL